MFEIFDIAQSLIVNVTVIIALLFLSAFFSGSETALTAASQARLHQLSLRGNRRASTVLRLRRRNDTLIGTILIGNNITNIAASALATSVLISLFDDAGVAYAMVGMTILVVIFAEVLPKTFAINNADIIFNSLQMIEVEKIYFKQKNNGDFKGSINFSAEGKDFIASSSGGMKLELNGEYTFGNAKINGDLLLEVLNLKDHEKLFSAPIKIKDNVASFLFIPDF